MDYREHSKDLLERKKSLTSAYAAIKNELLMLEEEESACKRFVSRAKADNSVTVDYNDRLINILVELDDCRFRKSVVERELRKIQTGLDSLNDYQRELIEYFYIEKQSGAADALMEKWFKERSSIYRDKSVALEQFTRSVYGVITL